MYLSPDADGALLAGVAGGDGGAFDDLYARYASVAAGVAAGVARSILGEAVLAKDAVQEAFLSGRVATRGALRPGARQRPVLAADHCPSLRDRRAPPALRGPLGQ